VLYREKGLSGWLQTQVVYPPALSRPSKY